MILKDENSDSAQTSIGRDAQTFNKKLQLYFFCFLKVPSSQNNKVVPHTDSDFKCSAGDDCIATTYLQDKGTLFNVALNKYCTMSSDDRTVLPASC